MHKLSFSLVNITTSSNLHRILLRVMALKLSDVDKFAHLLFGIGIIVPVNMPSGVCELQYEHLNSHLSKLYDLILFQSHHLFLLCCNILMADNYITTNNTMVAICALCINHIINVFL